MIEISQILANGSVVEISAKHFGYADLQMLASTARNAGGHLIIVDSDRIELASLVYLSSLGGPNVTFK